MRTWLTWVAAVAVIMASQRAEADDKKSVAAPYLAGDKAIASKKKKDQKDGWFPQLKLGASLNFATSSNVVGQIDGSTIAVSVQLDAALAYYRGNHEWRNTFKLNEAFSRTPAIDEFVKTTDILSLESLYLYHFSKYPWIGPYVRAQFDTQMLPGRDVRGAEVDYKIANLDGSETNLTGTSLHLSDPFQPFTIRESAGVFAQPVKEKNLSVEIKAGFGARHVFADNQFVVADDAATEGIIEVKELQTFHQGGPGIELDIIGKLMDGKISYYMGAEAMLPLIRSLDDPEGRNSLELANILLKAGASVKVFTWMSLDYQIRALREAQIRSEFQIQNNLLLTFSWTLLDGK